MFIRFRL